jgi:hypothetical protein
MAKQAHDSGRKKQQKALKAKREAAKAKGSDRKRGSKQR